jgi:CBS-domain-containing membrane protein
VGVVTVTDILVHDREYVRYLKTGDMTPRVDLRNHGSRLPEDFGIEIVDRTTVAEIMTPAVFTVNPDDPAALVIRKMLELQVHHLFVADDEGVLIGVISTCDILRRLGGRLPEIWSRSYDSPAFDISPRRDSWASDGLRTRSSGSCGKPIGTWRRA